MTEPTTINSRANETAREVVALVNGIYITEVPKDLFIPPDALELMLESFQGPMDLLLYLIKKQNLDIVELSIAQITEQYMDYISLMNAMQFELAAEYLVMAATLAEIKSRMLLPRPKHLDDEEGDPTAELIRRLQEYERFKQAAEDIDEMPRLHREIFVAKTELGETDTPIVLPETDLKQLLAALGEVMKRAEMFTKHHIRREALSVRERMSRILERVQNREFIDFKALFDLQEGKAGVVVTFLAMLELIKESLIELVQTEAFGPIHIRGAQA